MQAFRRSRTVSNRPSSAVRIALAAAASGAVSLLAVQSASAQFTPTNTWTGATDNLWATPTNWSNGDSPIISGARGDDVIFGGTTALGITLPTSPSAGRLNFNTTGGVSLTGNSGGNGMQLRGGVVLDANAGSVSIAGSMNLNGNTQSYINNNPAATLTVGNVNNLNNDSVVTFTVDGPGTIVMGGLNNSGSPTPTTSLVKNGTGTISIGNSSFRGSATLNSGSVLMPSSNSFGNNATNKTLTINGGDINGIGASARTIVSQISTVIGGDFGLNTNAAATQRVNFAGTVDLGGATRVITVGSQIGEFQGVVSNGAITKAGPGTLIIQGANTMGALQVDAGTLMVQGINALGDAAAGTNVASGAELSLNGITGTINEPLTIAGPGPGSTATGAITVENSANVTVASNVALSGDATIHVTGTGIANFSGGITAAGNQNLTLRGGSGTGATVSGAISLGTGSLIKTQANTWTLSAANTYSGGTTVDAGTLLLANANAISTGGALTVNTGVLRSQAGQLTALDVGALTVATGARVDVNDGGIVQRNGGSGTAGQAATQAATALLKTGLENGGLFDWLGSGISSTEANADNALAGSVLYGVGVVQNNLAAAGTADGTTTDETPGNTIYSSFKGRDVALNDTLVRYTYMGDADLDGSITGTDYSLIDAGFAASLAGWLNGDFDYSGAIDGTDYALIDNAFASQVGVLSDEFLALYDQHVATFGQEYVDALAAVQAGVVPEPGTLGVLALAGVGLLARRRNRQPSL